MKKSIVAVLLMLAFFANSAFAVTPVYAAEGASDVPWLYENVTVGGKAGVAVTAYTGTQSDILIPNEIGGLTVLKVGDNFQGKNRYKQRYAR